MGDMPSGISRRDHKKIKDKERYRQVYDSDPSNEQQTYSKIRDFEGYSGHYCHHRGRSPESTGYWQGGCKDGKNIKGEDIYQGA